MASTRGRTDFGPGNAPYPERRPTTTNTLSGVTRSRVQLLRQRRQLPSGERGFTTSSLHKAEQGYADPAAGAGRNAAAAAGGERDSGAADATSAYVRNLKEQVGVLQSELNMYRSGKPLVEAHNCDLGEGLERDVRQTMDKARDAASARQKEAQTADELRREMHALRKQIADERQRAEKVGDERRFAMREREDAVSAKGKVEQQLRHAGERLSSMENEIEYLKRELRAAKRKEADYVAHSTGAPLVKVTRRPRNDDAGSGSDCPDADDDADATAQPESPEQLAKAAVVHGIVPSSVAQRIVGDYQKNLAERNAAVAEAAELQRQVDARGELIDELTKSLNKSQEELATLVAAVRHEQQRYQMLIAQSESDRVALDDATRELAFVRLANRELTADRSRLQAANEELFDKIRAMVDERQTSDLAVANTVQATKQLQQDTKRVQDALREEQSINTELREQRSALQQELEATKAELADAQRRLGDADSERAKADAAHSEKLKQLEQSLKTLQTAHAQSHTTEQQTLKTASELLETLKRQENAGSASAASSAATTAAAPGPATPAASPAGSAAAGGKPSIASVLRAAQDAAASPSAASAPGAAAAAAAPAGAAAKPASATFGLFEAARAAMEREKKLREEAAAAFATAGRALGQRRDAARSAASRLDSAAR